MTGEALRAASIAERAAWLGAAAERLLDETSRAREALAASTGLSAPMVAWGARTTLETMREESLRSLADEAQATGGKPISSLSIVLAGNLFTAAARAVVVPLLLGIPVTVKASSRETLFPTMLRDALREADPDLGAAVDLVVFAGGDIERETELVNAGEVTAVYGSDSTIDAMKRRHPSARLLAHGHGVSTAYCGPEALHEGHVEETIANLALDISAYDQRGCLSPQVVYVAADSESTHSALAERLAKEGLTALERELPRGPLPLEVGASQAQWRGLAEVEGSLVAGDTYSIAIRPKHPVRWSPGYRNVTLASVSDHREALRAMEAFGPSLKCVGTDPISLASLRSALDGHEGLNAYACPLGTMQTPELDVPADGKPIWHGLLE